MLVMLAATIVTNLRCLCYCSTKVQYILSYRARYCAFVLLQYTGTVHTVIQGALLYVCVTAVQRYSTYCHTGRVTVLLYYCNTQVQYILSYRARYCTFVLLQYTSLVHTVIQGALLYVCVTAVHRYSTYCHTGRVTVRLCYCSTEVQYILSYSARYCAFAYFSSLSLSDISPSRHDNTNCTQLLAGCSLIVTFEVVVA